VSSARNAGTDADRDPRRTEEARPHGRTRNSLPEKGKSIEVDIAEHEAPDAVENRAAANKSICDVTFFAFKG
jgi:hypothetical protein